MTREEAIIHISTLRTVTKDIPKYRGKAIDEAIDITINALKQQSDWIPVTYKPMTEEEKKDYAEYTGYDIKDLGFMLDCPLPDDGETVLITDRLGNVEEDTFINDSDGCYFECNCDMDDIKAWMPFPTPYEPRESEGEE